MPAQFLALLPVHCPFVCDLHACSWITACVPSSREDRMRNLRDGGRSVHSVEHQDI